MPSNFPVFNIIDALAQRHFPTVTTWNRLEGRPRTAHFERALQAEVRDALWLLSKQWQMGEFRGSDAGSPVFAKFQTETTRLNKYRPDEQATQLFEYDVPLEAKVERRPIPLQRDKQPIALDLRLLMGRHWLKLIAGIGDYKQKFIDAYPITAPDPTKKEDAGRCAHPEVWQAYQAVAGHTLDGALLYAHLTANPGNHAYDGIAVDPGDQPALDARATTFVTWFERQFFQPPASGDNAWVPERLEYQFAASAPVTGGEKVYRADEYYQGKLDWYSFDIDASMQGLGAVAGDPGTDQPIDSLLTTLPMPISFTGMPNTRWWAFEEQKTNYGDINPGTTDLAKLLFMEFALVYANDWFLIPSTLPLGTIATVLGLVVTNVFGERLWVDAADRGPDADWQRWSMFTINQESGSGAADTGLLLLPIVPKIQEGPPSEEVLLLQDDVANMVWGVEKIVPLASGESKPGGEVARETLAFFTALLAAQQAGTPPPPAITYKASQRYQVMDTVPENWIPFLPVHVPGNNREIQFQRAALPRILEGDPSPLPDKVKPQTVLLREGLDPIPPQKAQTYFLHREEVPRVGARLMQGFQRTRWRDGSVFTWLRVRKQTGRGEGGSGLVFDQLVDVPPTS